MKSELNNIPKTNQFPALYQEIDGNYVVLFFSENAGTVVQTAARNCIFRLGFFQSNWASCFDLNNWNRLNSVSTILLTQE